MDAAKRTVIIDIDGTLYDNFAHDDKFIINKLFKNNILVKMLDRFLWMLNSLDVVSNPMRVLKLRLRIYAIVSLKSHIEVKETYKWMYQSLLEVDLISKRPLLEKLSNLFDITFVTSNIFATSVLYKKFDYNIVYSPTLASRRKQITKINTNNVISYVVGNNYMDDIFLAHKLGAKSIYVGTSIFKKMFKTKYNVISFNEALEILEGSP